MSAALKMVPTNPKTSVPQKALRPAPSRPKLRAPSTRGRPEDARPRRVAVAAVLPADEQMTIAEARGYTRQDLDAIATVAWHYLQNGALEIAETLFEGLHAVEPNRAYHALAMGAVLDRKGAKAKADSFYAKAAELDPTDARPDVNRAELAIEAGRTDRALEHLDRAVRKARRAGDSALEQKSIALIRHLQANRKRLTAGATR